MASLVKLCRHGRVPRLSEAARLRRWRRCGCAWVGDLYVEGRRRRVNLGADERQAKISLARLVADREEGRQLDSGQGVGVSHVARRWLAIKERNPAARSNSSHSYRSRVGHIEDWFGDRPVADVRPTDVSAFLERHLETRKPATVGGIYAALRGVLKRARAEGLIDVIPLPLENPIPQARPRDQRIPLGAVWEVVEAMPEPHRSAGALVLLTGLRHGELSALTPAEVDMNRGLVHVRSNRARNGSLGPPKTSHGARVIPLSDAARQILAARIAERPDGLLWPGSYRVAQDALRAALQAHGVHRPGMGWHTLRSAHAAILDSAGVALREAAQRMGHGDHTAQTLAYGWTAEALAPGLIDETVRRHGALQEPGRGGEPA
ncbi:MAG: site-specific integrase [Actinobacteria bacterium]|nr:site-specific integrase [Actinomycetota bacterium]